MPSPRPDTGRSYDGLLRWAFRSFEGKFLILLALVVFMVVLYFFNHVVEWEYKKILEARYGPFKWVALEEPGSFLPSSETAAASAVKSQFRLAVAPIISPEKTMASYYEFVQFLAKRLGREEGVLLQRESYAALNQLVRYGQCDLALVCTYSFVQGERDFGMKALAMPVVGDTRVYYSFIITGSVRPVESLIDLRGRRFASADLMSTSGWLFPAVWLKREGIDPTNFFSSHLITGSHDRSVHAVAAGDVDAAAVDSLVYEQMLREDPALVGKTQVMIRSPPYGISPLVVNPHFSDFELERSMQSLLMEMHRDDEGRRILSGLGVDRFVPPDDRSYDPVRQAVKEWEGR